MFIPVGCPKLKWPNSKDLIYRRKKEMLDTSLSISTLLQSYKQKLQ